MKQRPWSLVFLAVVHFIAPFGNIFINSSVMNVTALEYTKLLLHPDNRIFGILFLVLPILCGACIYSFKKWSYHLYLLLMCTAFIYSFVSWYQNQNSQNLTVLILFYGLNIILVSYFMIPNIRNIYFNSKIRWWETKPRYLTQIQTEIKHDNESNTGVIKNISEGGFFVDSSSVFKLNTPVLISFHFLNFFYEILAEVVFIKNPEAVEKGYGLKIIKIQSEKVSFKSLIAFHKKNHKIPRDEFKKPEETLGYWLKNILKKSSWLPKFSK